MAALLSNKNAGTDAETAIRGMAPLCKASSAIFSMKPTLHTHTHARMHTNSDTHAHKHTNTHTQRQPAACLVQLALCLLYGTMGFPLYASGTMSFFPIRFTGLLVARRVSSFKLRLCQFGVQRLCSDIAPQFWGSIGKLQFCKRVQRHSLESHLTKMNN